MAREFFDERMSPEALEDRVVSEAYREAKERFDKERIEPESFKDLYPEESIKEDVELASKLEERFAETADSETGHLALILEEIFSEQIELNEWLGGGVTTKKASRYDDFVNGVDEIVEIEEENSINHLAVAVDVTFGTNLYKKFERIKNEIQSGELTTVKYFENSEGTFKGKLSKVPRVIIGTSKENIIQLAKLWIEHNNKELSQHPVQLEILDEIVLQLEAYKNYAEKLNKEDVARIFDRQLAIAKKIRSSENKTNLRKKADLSYRNEDRVFEAIKKGVEALDKNLQE